MIKHLKAFAIWLATVPLVILNGILREGVLVRTIGDLVSPVSGIIQSVFVFVVAFLFIPRIRNCNSIDYVLLGVGWFLLTNPFGILPLSLKGKPHTNHWAMFDIRIADLRALVVVSLLLEPILAGFLGN